MEEFFADPIAANREIRGTLRKEMGSQGPHGLLSLQAKETAAGEAAFPAQRSAEAA
jgi:hypothetical protein